MISLFVQDEIRQTHLSSFVILFGYMITQIMSTILRLSAFQFFFIVFCFSCLIFYCLFSFQFLFITRSGSSVKLFWHFYFYNLSTCCYHTNNYNCLKKLPSSISLVLSKLMYWIIGWLKLLLLEKIGWLRYPCQFFQLGQETSPFFCNLPIFESLLLDTIIFN